MPSKTAISPTREENFSAWYLQVIKAAELAENAPVRGCMVIKPWGYGIWENCQCLLDAMLKKAGHQNAYFPLLIPLSRIEKEASHIEGFAKECAVVTHSRLEADGQGQLRPSSALEEPFVIRPTSEMIIGEMFARWIQSYRDLPLKINQWANVLRWEMRPRLFLRTMEFLWQEGHTAHATSEEALKQAEDALDLYKDFVENDLALPVLSGRKTKNERFPGAVETYCIEAMMQDGKALQAGTSHFLGQNFSRSFDMTFLDQNSSQQLAWTTSWGVSTRLVGAIIMTHSDDDGLVLPPPIAPIHVVILPLSSKAQDKDGLLAYCHQMKDRLAQVYYRGREIRVEIDLSDARPGEKAWKWVKRGVPIRIEVGPCELENKSVYVGYRDKPYREKSSQSLDDFVSSLSETLETMHRFYFQRALDFRERHTQLVRSENELFDFFKSSQGFAQFHWKQDDAIEERLKSELKITPRCILDKESFGPCIFSGETAPMTIFAKSY